MADPVRDRAAMIRQMDPVLIPGSFAYVSLREDPPAALRDAALAMFRETEGVSLIVAAALAPDAPTMRLITLRVRSALDGVGLTAAVAAVLAHHAIPCNMVAAYHHDHVFVPEAMAERALGLLRDLARGYVPPGS